MDNVNIVDFSGLRIRMASPEDIQTWSKGEVTKPETINYRTFRAEKDGLFDERIFGPTKDYECYCGKYKGIRYKGIICDRCGVEVTASVVRRERMGHIKLATPIAHIWFFKGASAPLSVLLNIPPQSLEKIIYYALYLVKAVDKDQQKVAMDRLEELKNEEIAKLDEQYEDQKENLRAEFNKQKESIKKKITSSEQQELALQENEIKEREQFKKLADLFLDRKSQKSAVYERIYKIVKSVKPHDVIEEDDYLFMKDKEVDAFLEVGMGSDTIYEILSNLKLQQVYDDVQTDLMKAKGEKRNKLLKRSRVLESLIRSEVNSEWMLMTNLPVIPPDLRPVVQLPGGKFATSDLNDLYRRVINRNNRLRQLIDLGAPEIILRNEKRMLQEAVDSLLDLQKSRGRARTGQSATAKALKSLSDILRGKQGRFRQNLLGKRVDYSGRSTIVVGPELQLDQCGLPKEMALELFKPYLLHEIIIQGYAPNIKSAKNFLENRDPVVYDILEDIINDHPVLLNRAPTLHKLSILGFYPVLTDGYAIKLHPTVCSGYNADFDGDAMGVFVPLSKDAIDEVRNKMLPYYNLLKPADGTPIAVPNKEMALGIYYITTFDKQFASREDKDLKYFADPNEALANYNLGKVKIRQPIFVRVQGKLIKTSVGRIMFNETIPVELQFINEPIKASDIKTIVTKAIQLQNDYQKTGQVIDKIKELGFWSASISSGLSVSVFDCVVIPNKDEIIAEADTEVEKVQNNFEQGLLTTDEKKRYSNKIWIDTTEKLADLTWDAIDEESPVKLIIKSGGARASREQLKQLSAIKGLVVDPMGKIIEVPTRSNYRQGLHAFEYVTTARGSRKGLTDSALKTADAGYLTRRLHDVAHDMIIREEDCGTTEGLEVRKEGERGQKFLERIHGRVTLENIEDTKGNVIVAKDTLLTDEEIEKVKMADVQKAIVRSPIYCKSKYGICQKCYGLDLSNNELATIGTPVGVLAAQSIGEPGTQLTMRVKHFGGIVISDVTQGLPRVEELFETRIPKVVSPITEFSGKAQVTKDEDRDLYLVKIISGEGETAEEKEFLMPTSQKLKIEDGDLVPAGTSLSEGYLNVRDVLTIRGLNAAQQYLINEIQDVYESQGIAIHDKHFEVIVRKMSDKIIIEDEGDTTFSRDEVVSKIRFEEENKKILAQGGRPAAGKVSILGISRAAIYTDSWLSAASFEQTTTVLANAAIKGQVDYLLGLKENVIIGRLIPVYEQLIEKYYKQFTNIYANNQSTRKESTKEKTDEDQGERAEVLV